MAIDTVSTLITQMGFPIVCCLALGWYVKYMTDNHKEEINKITQALNNNTLVLTKLCERLGVEENGEDNH